MIQEEETSFSRTLQKGIRRYKAVAEALRRGETVLIWCGTLLIRELELNPQKESCMMFLIIAFKSDHISATCKFQSAARCQIKSNFVYSDLLI